MKWRLVATYFAVILLTLTLIIVYIMNSLREYSINQKKMELMTKANILANLAGEIVWENGDDLESFVEKLEIPKGARTIITDKEAKVLFDAGATSNWRGKTMLNPRLSVALTGKDDEAVDDTDGWLTISVATPIIKEQMTTGAVFIEAPANDIKDYLSHMGRGLTVLSLVVSLLIGLLSFVMANVLTSPILTLTEKLREMAQGDEPKRVSLGGSREIKELVVSFNKMVDKVEELEEKRRRFVSDASHELKTPLSSIKLISDSIMGAANLDRATQNEFLQDMNNEVDRLTRIINKLLELAKMDISETKEKGDFRAVNLRELISDVIKALTPLAQKNKIEIKMLLTEDVVAFLNPDSIWAAIYNIIDNSIKYTPDGGWVYVELYKSMENIYITIVDSGMGMTADESDKIFDRFYRVDTARARETGGTGLGLSIALGAVRMHNGYITVESREGEGSLFRITLPILGAL